jgi:hypothetical protein
MTNIRSSIGESNFAGQGQKRLVVGDESGAQSFVPGQKIDPAIANTLRRQAQENKEQVEQRNLGDSRRRVEIITGIGRRFKEVPVETSEGTVIFTIRTLKTFEQTCLSQVIEQSERLTMDDGRIVFAPTSIAKIRIEALSHALFLIDGQSIDIILGTANSTYEEQVIARKELIEEMDGALIVHLYENYEKLAKETYDGYAPKNIEEAREVAEAISKSGENT